MVEVNFVYQGALRCECTHAPSSSKLITDAPADNYGKGEAFSPTDLVGTALISCIITTMAIVAERKGIKLDGSKGKVIKEMSTSAPRRISKLTCNIEIPLPATHPSRASLEAAAHACPVHKSLHPETQIQIDFNWIG